jgi:hypothetical protein
MTDNVIKADFSRLPKESKLIREIVDQHSYEGVLFEDLEEDELLDALELLAMYVPFLEYTLKANDVEELELDIKE